MATSGTGTGKPIETYSWLFGDPKGETIDCFKSRSDRQTVCRLWEAGGLSDFHDVELAEATKKINSILGRIEKGNRDKKRKLSFIKFANRLMIIWATYGVVGPDDDFRTIKRALKLRSP